MNTSLRDEYISRTKWVKDIDDDEGIWDKHFKKWNFFDYQKQLNVVLNSPGQVFLYERLENDKVSYPGVGIFLNYLPCDQTLDIEWFDIRRTWELHKEISWVDIDGVERKTEAMDFSSVIQNMPQWSDYLLIYGVWDRLPDWKTLRKHYENTWWFRKPLDVLRENKISQLLS